MTIAELSSPSASLELTPEERGAYREQGYFVRKSLFNERELEKLRNAVEGIHKKVLAAAHAAKPVERVDNLRFQDVLGSRIKWEWKESMDAIRSMEPVYHLSPAVDAIIDDERLCTPIRGLLNTPGVSLFTDKLNFKRPHGAPFPWHQDAPYWAYGCSHLNLLVSVQIYLDNATEENGCLWMVPGSHLNGHVPAPTNREGVMNKLYSDVDRLKLPRVPIIAPAGSAIFFDGYVVHGSKSNNSDQSRRALIFTYQPPRLSVRDTNSARTPYRERSSLGVIKRQLANVFRGPRGA